MIPEIDPLSKESAENYYRSSFQSAATDEEPATAPECIMNPEALAPLKHLPFPTHRPIHFNRRTHVTDEDSDSAITFSPLQRSFDTDGSSSTPTLNGVIMKLDLVDRDGRRNRINKPMSIPKFLDYMRETSKKSDKNYHDHDDSSVNSYSSQGNLSLGIPLTYSLTHLLTYSLTHLLTYSLIHSFSRIKFNK